MNIAKTKRVAPDDATIYTCANLAACRGGTNGHPFEGTPAAFGLRRDERMNSRCATCRAALAATGAVGYHSKEPVVPRDAKALRVVERWAGFPYRAWRTEEAVRWQWKRGISLEDVWTERMRRLAERAERCVLARKRIEARRVLGIAA